MRSVLGAMAVEGAFDSPSPIKPHSAAPALGAPFRQNRIGVLRKRAIDGELLIEVMGLFAGRAGEEWSEEQGGADEREKEYPEQDRGAGLAGR